MAASGEEGGAPVSMLTALVAELTADSGVSTLVGTRIRPGSAAQSDTLPVVIIDLLGDAPEHHMEGVLGLTFKTFQITSLDEDRIDADALDEAVRQALDGFRGTMGSGDNTAAVRMCHRTSTRTDVIEDQAKAGQFYHAVRTDYRIAHTESVPTFD